MEELIHKLDISQRQITIRLGLKARATYTGWKKGRLPDRDTLVAIAARWQVSIDSLLAMSGTDRIEPSPALRLAQETLLHDLAQRDMPGDPIVRVRHLHKIIREGTGMSEEAWCEWLQIASMEQTEWTDDALSRVAFLAGWYDEAATWLVWLKTGQADVLNPLSERELRRYVEYLVRSGMTLPAIRRKLEG